MAAAPVLALAGAVPASARVTPPTAGYELYNHDSWFDIQVASNPSNYGMQSELKCVYSGGQAAYYYGGWVFSSGVISTTTSPCTSQGGTPAAGYFRYRKSNPIRVTCWVPGNSRTGFC
jgi:hypothetical protein